MAAMEMILLKDVDNLGYANDVVKVKPGYGRNFLIPQKLAAVANSTNKKILAERLKVRDRKEVSLLAKINEVKEKIQKVSVRIEAKVGTTDKIFGSVTTHQIQEAILTQTGIEIERRKISFVEGAVKVLGNYTAKIDLAKDHTVEIPFEVVAATEA
jgi:large subunit ribosomal protein L9